MSKIDTGTQELLASKENGVGILTMNRPEARNAMSGEMNAAMQEMLAQFEADTEIRCVVLTGAGKGFCAGEMLKEWQLLATAQLEQILLIQQYTDKECIKEQLQENFLRCQNLL